MSEERLDARVAALEADVQRLQNDAADLRRALVSLIVACEREYGGAAALKLIGTLPPVVRADDPPFVRVTPDVVRDAPPRACA